MPADISGRESANAISQIRQFCARAAAVEFAQEQYTGEKLAVVLLQYFLGRGGDRRKLGNEPCRAAAA
jgi:hypothetical protein